MANQKIIRIGEVGCLGVSTRETIFFGVRESLLGAGQAPTRFASASNLSVEACQLGCTPRGGLWLRLL